MSVLVVGVSHRTAPVSVLERLAMDGDGVDKLLTNLSTAPYVREATVLNTCNRIEIYAEVERFHGSVEAVSKLLCELSTADPEAVVPHLYVHYDDASVSHLFHVAAGLDSMVVGEGQILGQVRDALRAGQEFGSIGPVLNLLFQQSLRVGKRTHAETGIDQAAPSLVSVSLDRAREHLGDLTPRRALVVGAGAMAGLAVSTLAREAVSEIVIANRSRDAALRLASVYGGRAAELHEIQTELDQADLVISCTGSPVTVLDADQVARALQTRPRSLALIDLALPHDIDPAVAELDGVHLIGLAQLADEVNEGDSADIGAVRGIVSEEVSAFLAARRAASVTPTVVALRSMATSVVEAELLRLFERVPNLDAGTRQELEQALRRVADKLLHQPTVRVKELAGQADTVTYAAALAELFALDPDAVEAVTRVEGR